MVEHLIVAHSCKTLNYVGGPADSQENLLRWQAYEDVLQRYGIPLEMTESGMKAMKWRAVSVHSYIFRKTSAAGCLCLRK